MRQKKRGLSHIQASGVEQLGEGGVGARKIFTTMPTSSFLLINSFFATFNYFLFIANSFGWPIDVLKLRAHATDQGAS